MKYIYSLSIFFIITSCGGGGGGGSTPTPIAVPFSITLGLTSFSVNDEETYEGVQMLQLQMRRSTFQYSIKKSQLMAL